MRTAAVQSNPDLQALFFVLICGGMMSEITQRHNGNLTSQDSVATAYLNDPFFGSVNGKLEIMEKAGEDKILAGGLR